MKKPIDHIARAKKAWPILVNIAKGPGEIEYGQLSRKIGVHVRAISYVLGVIQSFCIQNGYPALTVSVVDQKHKLGGGFNQVSLRDVPTERKRVRKYKWEKATNHFFRLAKLDTDEKIETANLIFRGSLDDILRRIKARGGYQAHFKKLMKRVYNNMCPISGTTIERLLEAAHIKPNSRSFRKEKIDPQNGILLNSFHHKLFDMGLITLNEDLQMVRTSLVKKFSLSDFDKAALKQLPVDFNWVDEENRPNLRYIRARNRILRKGKLLKGSTIEK